MMVVLRENEWAKQRIDNCELGRHPFETLTRVAKYYLEVERQDKQAARSLLDVFLLKCNPSASVIKWEGTMDSAIKFAVKHGAVNIDYIPVSDREMETIKGIKGAQAQRLALTLLCLSKYWDEVNGVTSHWVNSEDSEIMKIANINTSTRRQCLLYNQLYEAGLIRFSRKIDNTNVQVCFIEDGEPVMKISDLRNLGFQYKLFLGDNHYYRCKECGLVVRKENLDSLGFQTSGRPRMYCRECALSIKLKKNVNSVMNNASVSTSKLRLTV